jgi:hypothetical protein
MPVSDKWSHGSAIISSGRKIQQLATYYITVATRRSAREIGPSAASFSSIAPAPWSDPGPAIRKATRVNTNQVRGSRTSTKGKLNPSALGTDLHQLLS